VAAYGSSDSQAGKKYAIWNRLLGKAIDAFELKHPYSTAFEFSSHDTFTRILDDPVKFGFKEEDESAEGGGIWVDHLHPTSAIHAIVAEEIEAFLREQPQNFAPGTPSLENEEPQT
jgi:phospholipase/lecithinase/hemolysin